MNKPEPTTRWGELAKMHSREQAKQKATDEQWYLINVAVNAFSDKYPHHWQIFQEQLRLGKSKYNIAKQGGLKKSNFRHTASFPIIYAKEPLTGELVEVDSLLPVLEKIIPKLTHKHSVNYAPFLKKFPYFRPGEKVGAGQY